MTTAYDATELDNLCQTSLCQFFNSAAVAFATFTHVEIYHPDWDNLDNDGFVNNATFYGVQSLISNTTANDVNGKPGSLTHTLTGDTFSFASMMYSNQHHLRLQEVLAFAQKWIAQDGATYAAPRLIELPGLKMTALWLAGEKNVFIPVTDFHTRPGDAIAPDMQYLDKVRTAHAEAIQAYADVEDDEGPNLLGGGGGRPRPPGGATP